MANLIPPQAKKSILVEYWVRAVSVWLVLLGVAALALAVLNVPVYILIQNQLQTYNNLYDDASAQNTSFEQIESDIVLANNTAVLLSKASDINPLLPQIEAIERLAGEGISVNSFNLVREDTQLPEIQISGVAADRESLVQFSRDLEATSDFSSAEIPLSNLAKDSNIPFTINIILATANSAS